MTRILIAAVLLIAQAPDATKFEVASIKRNRSVSTVIGGAGSLDTYRRTNATLLTVLREAYKYRFIDSEIIGAPEWVDRDKFDIVAKAGGGSRWSSDMIVPLLQDRFRLWAHEEVRERDVYRLVMDRPDRQLGPKLRKSATDVDADMKLPRLQRRCKSDIRPDIGRFVGTCVTFDWLLDSTLHYVARRRVVNDTALTGTFDIDLSWDPTFDLPPDQRVPSDAPSIFTAVREQLGLRLEPAKVRIPVLVIDSVEPPAED